jgi:hypothetical protein
LLDVEAAKKAAAESAAMSAQTQRDYGISNAWTQKQTDAINAQTAGISAGSTSGAAAAPKAYSGKYMYDTWRGGDDLTMSTDNKNWIKITPELAKNDPDVRARMQQSLDVNFPTMLQSAPSQAGAIMQAQDFYNNMLAGTYKGGGGSNALTPPSRPTGKVSWQDDQKYWRDLDAYNKAHKLGAYR